MSRKNNKIQAMDLLVNLFGCSSEDMSYLIHLINKAQNRYKEDILDSIMDGLILDCASYNLRSIMDELFGELGFIVLANMAQEKTRDGGRCEILLDGSKVRDKKYSFDLSAIESDHITDKSKHEVINEFNNFLEKFLN